MPATSVLCPVLGAHITRILDVEGACIGIVCPEYAKLTNGCRLRKGIQSGGPLSQLLERVERNTLDSRNTRCEFV
jgi:hypothetical protein